MNDEHDPKPDTESATEPPPAETEEVIEVVRLQCPIAVHASPIVIELASPVTTPTDPVEQQRVAADIVRSGVTLADAIASRLPEGALFALVASLIEFLVTVLVLNGRAAVADEVVRESFKRGIARARATQQAQGVARQGPPVRIVGMNGRPIR